MLKLYFAPGACSLAPHIILEEVKVPYELIRVDLKNKTYGSENYLKVNPKGSVPALQLKDGKVLTETVAILQFLADQKPEARLVPTAGSWEKYQELEWLNFISTEVHKGFSPLWKADNSEEIKAKAKKVLDQKLNLLEAHLQKHDFLMGKNFSVADAYLFTVLNWSTFLKIDMSGWAALVKYMDRIKTRPATLAALQAEGLLK